MKSVDLKFAVAVFAVVCAVFAINVRNEFLHYDDNDYIVKNAHIAEGLTPRSAHWALLSRGYASNWHPLSWMSHALDVTVARTLGLDWRAAGGGRDGSVTQSRGAFAKFVHGENVVLHAVNAAVLWYLLTLAFGRPRTAVFFALLWAIHPLRVEVVAWASERKELVSVLLMLLTMVFWLKRREAASFGCFALALLAKPVAVSLPIALFTWDWLMMRRDARESAVCVLPFAGLSAAACWLTVVSQTAGFVGGRDWTWTTKVISAVEAPVVYLVQTVWPAGLSFDYPIPDWTSWPLFAAGAVLLLVMGAACVWHLIRPSRWSGLCAFAVAWCYVGLVPMLGIVKVGFEPHNDRYTYWIGCGAAFCACAAAVWLQRLWAKYARQLALCGALLLAVLSVLSIRQSLVWRDTVTLFDDAVRRNHREMIAQGLGELLVLQGAEGGRRAEDILRDTLTVKKSADARAALALHLAAFKGADGGDAVREARLLARYSIEDDPNCRWAYAALAHADRREGRHQVAYANMKKAVELGYESQVRPVKLDEWKRRAEAAAEEERHVQE